MKKSLVFPCNPCSNPSGQCLRLVVNKPLDIFILLDLITVCQRRQLYPLSLSYNHYKPLQLLHLRNVHIMVLISNCSIEHIARVWPKSCILACLMHWFTLTPVSRLNIFQKGRPSFLPEQFVLRYYLI